MFPTSESKKKILIKCVVFFAGRLLGPDRPVQILRGPFSRSKQKKRIVEEKNERKKRKKKRYELICISKCETVRKAGRGEEGRERERERKGEEGRGRERATRSAYMIMGSSTLSLSCLFSAFLLIFSLEMRHACAMILSIKDQELF